VGAAWGNFQRSIRAAVRARLPDVGTLQILLSSLQTSLQDGEKQVSPRSPKFLVVKGMHQIPSASGCPDALAIGGIKSECWEEERERKGQCIN